MKTAKKANSLAKERSLPTKKQSTQSRGHAIFDEAEKRHETQLNALINQYEENGDSENVARIKAENAVLPVYRKELRKVLLENLQWMRAMKKDPTFKKVMETQKELKDTEGFDWLESTELAIDKRKFLLNRLYEKQPIPQDEDQTYYECYRIFFLDLCIAAFQ